MKIRANTYFKGGPEDQFISGLWIGDERQEDTMFINCDFNGVEASFTRCVFIDCNAPPEGIECQYFDLDKDVRLSVEWKQLDGTWK